MLQDHFQQKDNRIRKGVFPTPQIWVEKSQEYLAKAFGEVWQEEYYIWDCCAGTCNLLAGLTNPHRVWASTIDQPDVDIVHEIIDRKALNLLKSHVFQFDFLNDDFSNLPKGLQDIINDPEKRKKLIIYMNPPYAEGDNRVGQGRSGIAVSAIQNKYAEQLGYTKREFFVQFLARIYFEIPGCKIAEFSKLKSICAPKFLTFRNFFKARLKKCFVVPADTFDNVHGQFPIGFKIWDTGKKETFKRIVADVVGSNGNIVGKKTFWSYDHCRFINDWAETFNQSDLESLGTIIGIANDFQNQNTVRIEKSNKPWNHQYQWQITRENLLCSAIYFAVRKCIVPTWLNDRDQFLFPNGGYQTDTEFQCDCLIFTLFHSQNRICRRDGVNHWIPFTAGNVNAKEDFQSTFMSDFLKKHKKLSDEAKAVFEAGKALWKYYHKSIQTTKKALVDASLYEIREYFKGRDEKGRMKTKSTDERFNELDAELRSKLKILAEKIQPKVYEYGFLLQ